MSTSNGSSSYRTTSYFFLSYAHSAPLAGADEEPTDFWVKTVFEDLSRAVREYARLERGTTVGYFDGLLDAGADWKARATRELGVAQVFVPLYSPRYFAMSWPGREWACFNERLRHEPPDAPSGHIVPVLWAPLTGSPAPANAPDAIDVVGDAPDEYAENGLRALRMLNLYREQYQTVVARIGEKIVDAARYRPLNAQQVSPLSTVGNAFRLKGADDDFVVAVAAPTRRTMPPERSDAWYGTQSTAWRPFGDREQLSLADHAVSYAERLNLSTSDVGVGEVVDDIASIPAVVLVDPWIAVPVNGGDSPALRALRRLYNWPQTRLWALPLLVLNGDDPESARRNDELVGSAMRILEAVGAPVSEVSQRGSGVVRSIDEFAQAMPALVAEAERRYMRYSPDIPDHLGDEGRPDA